MIFFLKKINFVSILLLLLTTTGIVFFVSKQKRILKVPEQFLTTEAVKLAVVPDQCRQGGIDEPQTWVECRLQPDNLGWVSGNAGASNSHYREGESISYRIKVSGEGMAGYNVRLLIGYQTTKGSQRALDFLTSNNRWQPPETDKYTTPDIVCDGIPGCGGNPTLVPIPQPLSSIFVDIAENTTSATNLAPCIGGLTGVLQPTTSFLNIPPEERQMAFYNVSGRPVLSYYHPITDWTLATDQTQKMIIFFQANADVVVISFGAHIANRNDWGCANGAQSAAEIDGSPYHLSTYELAIDLNNNGIFNDKGEVQNIGSQDLSLAAAAVVVEPPPSISPSPSTSPSFLPSPSYSPSPLPSTSPSTSPSFLPSPSYSPSPLPSTSPSFSPSPSPSFSASPSQSPSPSTSPSFLPSPSYSPSPLPSTSPSTSPLASPSLSPSISPSASPSFEPSLSPSPSNIPSPSSLSCINQTGFTVTEEETTSGIKTQIIVHSPIFYDNIELRVYDTLGNQYNFSNPSPTGSFDWSWLIDIYITDIQKIEFWINVPNPGSGIGGEFCGVWPTPSPLPSPSFNIWQLLLKYAKMLIAPEDINKDGKINLLDFSEFIKNWL